MTTHQNIIDDIITILEAIQNHHNYIDHIEIDYKFNDKYLTLTARLGPKHMPTCIDRIPEMAAFLLPIIKRLQSLKAFL